MDPLLTAAAFSTAASLLPARSPRDDEDAFYDRHGGHVLRQAAPAAPAIAVAVAVVVLTGILGGA